MAPKDLNLALPGWQWLPPRPRRPKPVPAFRSLKMAFAGHLQKGSDKDFEGLPFWRILGFPTAAPQGGLASRAGQGVETVFS